MSIIFKFLDKCGNYQWNDSIVLLNNHKDNAGKCAVVVVVVVLLTMGSQFDSYVTWYNIKQGEHSTLKTRMRTTIHIKTFIKGKVSQSKAKNMG